MTRAFVGLGSNQGGPERQLEQALRALAEVPRTLLAAQSAWYRTRPVGDANQADFLNAVVEIETGLTALELLDELQRIEREQGRRHDPARRWGPRTLDLDLLLFGHEIIHHSRLNVPHPRLALRAFVLKPLADLAPALLVPGYGRVGEILANADCSGIVARVRPPETGIGEHQP